MAGKLPAIRMVTFDALHTIITPRYPIHVQYSNVFRPYLGTLEPESIRGSFKRALQSLQVERPAYAHGSKKWWADVIQRTALGAGADADSWYTGEAICHFDLKLLDARTAGITSRDRSSTDDTV